MEFYYKAFNSQGELIEGVIISSSISEVKKQLKDLGLIPLVIEEHHKQFIESGTLSDHESYMFFNQLSLLLKGGVNLDQALILCRNSTENKKVKGIINKIINDIKIGKEFHQALHETRAFSSVIIILIKVGEKTGQLKDILSSIADYILFNIKFKREIRNALLYPLFLIFASFIAIIGILKFIVPRFFQIFGYSLEELPIPSKILLYLSQLLNLKTLSSLSVIIVLSFLLFHQSRVVKLYIKNFLSLISCFPPIKSMMLSLDLSRFFFTMSYMIKSGIDFLTAFNYASEIVFQKDLKLTLKECIPKIREGKSISETLGTISQFPSFVRGLIKVGEESGNLSKVFEELYQFFDEKFKNKLRNFVVMLEPAIITVVSVIIGLIVFSLILTVTSITNVRL